LREFLYNAECAKLNSSIEGDRSIVFNWDGYNDSLQTFVVETIQRLK